ncbi:MAG: YnbE family lipoprotein [Gammaproteobacteria bacterium]|nr:YnbE family lipoprotein [Gammaproteobacteria bacterium]NVK88047.1 YnbE family lipoprotein [Gammaproteobacteria bacterium]
MKNLLLPILTLPLLAACTIKVEPSDKPINVNLNITHDIRIKIQNEVEDVLNDDELF